MSSKIFMSYLNTLKKKYGKLVLFYDGASWRTSGDVEEFLEKNRKTITPVRFPGCSSELNPAGSVGIRQRDAYWVQSCQKTSEE
ncbi:MAG: transposase [Candidatus Parvarchaeota archaeon]